MALFSLSVQPFKRPMRSFRCQRNIWSASVFQIFVWRLPFPIFHPWRATVAAVQICLAFWTECRQEVLILVLETSSPPPHPLPTFMGFLNTQHEEECQRMQKFACFVVLFWAGPTKIFYDACFWMFSLYQHSGCTLDLSLCVLEQDRVFEMAHFLGFCAAYWLEGISSLWLTWKQAF